MTDTEKTEYYAQHPFESSMANTVGTYLTKGLGFGVLGMGMDAANGPGYVDRKLNILRGTHPPANSPLAGGPLEYGPDTSDPASVGMVFPTEKDQINAKEVGAYPYGNFYDSSLSSRTDVSGYPLRQSELKSLERGITSSAVKKGDPFAGYFNSDPTLNQIAKYADPSTHPAGFFPTGTAYTDKAFYRDRLGNLFTPGDSIPAGTTVSGNMALADQNRLQGSAQQRAIEANKPVDPFAKVEADDAALRAEQAALGAAEEKAYAERVAAKESLEEASNKENSYKHYSGLATGLERLKNIYKLGVNEDNTPLNEASLNNIAQTIALNTLMLKEANANGALPPDISRDVYKTE
jgi:hypothetical protein